MLKMLKLSNISTIGIDTKTEKSIEISGHLLNSSLFILSKSRSSWLLFIELLQEDITSGTYLFNSFIIVFALNKKMPLFQVYLLSLRNICAVSKSGFSVNLMIFSPEILFLLSGFSALI